MEKSIENRIWAHALALIVTVFLQPKDTLAAPDIEVTKTVDNPAPIPGEPVEFAIRVTNVGDEAAIDVRVQDLLPPELIMPNGTAAFPATGSYDPDTGEWIVGDLDPADDAVLILPAMVSTADPPECIVNTANVTSPPDVNDGNNAARAAIRQAGTARCVDLDVDFGIRVGTTVIVPSCDLQDRYGGHVDVTNHGPDAARNIVVTISQSPVVGPNLRFDDADCFNAPASHCEISEIALGETVSINVTSDLFQSYESFEQTIAVGATTSDTDYDLSNNDPADAGTAGGFSRCTDLGLGVPGMPIGPACFIATAAYGSPLHPHLDSLRNFRDRYLVGKRPGRALVRSYYRHSPPLAKFIAERDWLRAVVRGVLTPIVYAIEYPRAAALLVLGLIGGVLAGRRRGHIPVETSAEGSSE